MFWRQLTATYLQQLVWSFSMNNSHDPTPQNYFCNLRSASRPGKQGRDKFYPLSYPTDGQNSYRNFLQELFPYCDTGLPTGALLHFINLLILGQEFKHLPLQSPGMLTTCKCSILLRNQIVPEETGLVCYLPCNTKHAVHWFVPSGLTAPRLHAGHGTFHPQSPAGTAL